MRPSDLRRVPVWVVWVLGALPLAMLTFDMLAGRLGVGPVAAI